jgi:hypothetical protein
MIKGLARPLSRGQPRGEPLKLHWMADGCLRWDCGGVRQTWNFALFIGLMLAGTSPLEAAGVSNGSFESGSFYSWQVNVSQYFSGGVRDYRAAGSSQIIPAANENFGLAETVTPVLGNRFAALGSLADGNFTETRTYQISLSQTFTLNAGDCLSGWAAFFNGDLRPQDRAWVKIFDTTGTLLATPWQQESGLHSERTPFGSVSEWTEWHWQALSSASYILRLGLTTEADNTEASYGFFDGILVSPAAIPVPEPSAAALLGLSALALITRRRNSPKS